MEGPSQAEAVSRASSGNANQDIVQPNAWLALQCGCITGTRAGLLLWRRPGSEQVFEPLALWPSVYIERKHLGAVAEAALQHKAAQHSTGSDTFHTALPIEFNEVLVGAVAIEVQATTGNPADALRLLRLGIGWLVQFATDQARRADAGTILTLQRALAGYMSTARRALPVESGMELVNWLRETYACSRVSVGILRKGSMRLLAISQAAWFDPKSHYARDIENAMDEAYDQGRGVCLPARDGERHAIAIAHRELAAEQAVQSVILSGADGHGLAVLLLERPPDLPFSAEEAAQFARLAELVGPMLEVRVQAERWLGERVHAGWRSLRQRLADPRRPALRVGLAGAALALAALLFLNAEWRINADAVIEGQEHRALAAPFDGYIHAAHFKAGQNVSKGQALAELDQRSLQLEYDRYSAEQAQRDRQYRDALSRHDRPAAGVALAQMHEAEAQRVLVEDKLNRAVLAAPFDAVVVSGDLSEMLGSPVEQGKVLFELAPLDAYRVFLKVDERDIRGVQIGQHGRLVLASLSGETLPFKVKNISVPEAADGRNVFRVEAELDGASLRLRPGMQGVGKIDAGSRNLFWIWTHKTLDWLRLQIWRWWP